MWKRLKEGLDLFPTNQSSSSTPGGLSLWRIECLICYGTAVLDHPLIPIQVTSLVNP